MAKTRKRFIAGAICPQCKKQDTIILFGQQNEQHIACVDCGFLQFKREEPTQTKEAVVKFTKKKIRS